MLLLEWCIVRPTVMPANQIIMSRWLMKVSTLIFLRNILQSGLSQHLTGPSLPLHMPPKPPGLGQVGRGPGSISWRYRESGRKRRRPRPPRSKGLGTPRHHLSSCPNTPPAPSLLVAKPTEQLSVLSRAPWRLAVRLKFWVQIPGSPLIGCELRAQYSNLCFTVEESRSRDKHLTFLIG